MARGGGEKVLDAEACWAKALELLGRRPHFAAELEKKLRVRGFSDETAGAAVARAVELGYLDDTRLAGGYAEELAARRGLGRSGIARELARRGAAGEAVEGALSGISAEADLERARATAARWRRRGGSDPDALARHLDRKGFTRHAIFRVLREFAPDAPTPDDAD